MATDSKKNGSSQDDSLGMLQRRRIEANIIAPIYRNLVKELGKDKADEIIRVSIAEDARQAGERFAAAEPHGTSMETFIDIQELWTREDALVTETTVANENEFRFKVHKCAYSQMYKEMGIGEIGQLLSCTRDLEFIAGYDPSIELDRPQTLMEGADYCDFHYIRKANS